MKAWKEKGRWNSLKKKKWESIKAEELNKRFEQKEWVHTKDNLNDIKRDKWKETFKKSIQKQTLIKREKASPMSKF